MFINQDVVDDLMRKYDDADDRRRVRTAANKSARVNRDPRGKRGRL